MKPGNLKKTLFIFLWLIGGIAEEICFSQSGAYKWFNADHSPFGALSSFVMGLKDEGGGFMSGRSFPPGKDIYIAFKSPSAGVRILPFVHNKSEYISSDFYPDNEITREFRLCSDTWQTPHFQLTFYSPIWNIPDLQHFNAEQQRLVFCPAQLIEISWDNLQSTYDAEILFGVQTKVVEDIQATVNGDLLKGFYFKSYDLEKGYLLAFANQEQCEIELMKSENILKEFADDDYVSGQKSGGFLIRVPPGLKGHVFLLVNHFNADNITTGITSTFYYSHLFTDFIDASHFYFQLAEQIKRYCLLQDQKLLQSGLNPARQFLIAQSIHSYYANTAFLSSAAYDNIWVVFEGEYRYMNTLDLAVDLMFHELRLHPWTVKNVLNLFATRYFYYDEVRPPRYRHLKYPGGISFTHDMGRYLEFSEAGRSHYEGEYFMSHEELVNWILTGAVYWKSTGDDQWLQEKAKVFRDCLLSLINRDHHLDEERDGIGSYITRHLNAEVETTTYDGLDVGLKRPYESLYLGVKTWAAYLALYQIFQDLQFINEANLANSQALRAAQTIVENQVQDGNGRWIPALFNDNNAIRVIPALEGLIFPFKLGDFNAVAPDGRFSTLINALEEHIQTILNPGICLDATTGAWKVSSGSSRTWESKVFLNQFIAEHILNCTGNIFQGNIDEIHANLQLTTSAAEYCFSDQLISNGGYETNLRHYPRGVTSSLWWESVDLSNPIADRLLIIPETDTLKRALTHRLTIEAQNDASRKWAYLVFTQIQLTSSSATLEFSTDMTHWASEIIVPLDMGAGSFYLRDSVAEIVNITMQDLSGAIGAHSQQLNIDLGSTVPVELSNFSADLKDDNVLLSWTTLSETDNYGFEIQRRLSGTASWQSIGFIHGAGTSAVMQRYSYTDHLTAPGQYFYRLRQIDDGGSNKFSQIINVIYGLPLQTRLSQNYPNPFNQSTIIHFEMPAPAAVKLRIYDVQGKVIRRLVDTHCDAGFFNAYWDGRDEQGNGVSSGIYFYELQTGTARLRNRLAIIK